METLNSDITSLTDNDITLESAISMNDPVLNGHITLFEVKKAIDSAKRGKACGVDLIPSDVLKNDTSVSFLHMHLMFASAKDLSQAYGVKVS